MANPKLHRTTIDLDQETREQVITILNQQLADTFDLYTQTKQAHWNVKGLQFFQLHELYDKLATEVLPFVDEIAERATTLGGTALGTARMSSSKSRLPEYPVDAVSSTGSLQALIERYSNLAASTREAIDATAKLDDADTADLFTAISRTLDKSLWFLEAHVQE